MAMERHTRRSEKLLARKLMAVVFIGERMSDQVLMISGDRDNVERWISENRDDYDSAEDLQAALVKRNLAIWVDASHFDGVRTRMVEL